MIRLKFLMIALFSCMLCYGQTNKPSIKQEVVYTKKDSLKLDKSIAKTILLLKKKGLIN